MPRWCWLAAAILGMLLPAGCVQPRREIGRPPPAPIMQTRPRAVQPAPPPAPPPQVQPTPVPRTSLRSVTIIVDPGHGGGDPGTLGVRGSTPEKTITLNIARQVAALLRERGARVIMTRDNDRKVELDDRAALADRTRADLFVSIHVNASRKKSMTGALVYLARGPGGHSLHAAEQVVAALRRAGVQCDGTRRAGFKVLVGHSQPAILIECGFLTNGVEAAKLSSRSYQQRLAEAIADGVAAHFGG